MKNLIFATVLAFAFFACDNTGNNAYNEGAEDNQTGMVDTTTTSTNTWDATRTSDFVQAAASGGKMEVELGQMAQEKGTSQEVKDFGQMMVDDHSKANQELQSVAQSMQINLPQTMQDMHQQKVDQLKGLSGAEFDQAYVNMMVEDHREDIQKFEEAQNSVSDQQLSAWIQNTLPVLREHYNEIQEIQQTAQNGGN